MKRFSKTTDPELQTFLPVDRDTDFPVQNLPYGVFRRASDSEAHVGVAIGSFVLDLSVLERLELFTHPALRDGQPFTRGSLNPFMALGPEVWRAARQTISSLLTGENPSLKEDSSLQEQAILSQFEVEMLLPVEVGDYTDFYSSREHATNVGTMFRGPENALMPNWLHLPVAYHGRASSVVVSGTDIVRPWGQINTENAPPEYGHTRLLDFELEMGFFIGPGNSLGRSVRTSEARDHIFGMVLVNDWSARDIQKWEYVPLGPFLGKNFATTVSPWVVPLEALEPFACDAPVQEPAPLAYLQEPERRTFDIRLEVDLIAADEAAAEATPHREVICRSNFKHLYWTMEQQVAHHTVNGCNLRTGDLLASGTISGKDPSSYGSLLELSWRGERPLKLSNGATRTFLEDGDRVVLRGWAQGEDYRIGFGEAEGRIVGVRRHF